MLGHVLYSLLKDSELYDVFNVVRSKSLDKNSYLCDVSNFKELKSIINKIKPEIIINCIGILIKESSENPKNAIKINSLLPHYLIEVADKINSKLVHVSTDCVFDGKDGSYSEDSITNATDIYGKTKSLGEVNYDKHLTIRTSIIGPDLKKNGQGLLNWFLSEKTNKVYGYKKALWSGVTTLELSKAIRFSIENDINGLWNLTNSLSISKYSLLLLINKYFKKNSVEIEQSNDYINDKSLISVREIDYNVPTYESMIQELYEYCLKNKKLYNYKL